MRSGMLPSRTAIAVAARGLRHALHPGAVEGLRLGDRLALAAQEREVLRQGGEGGPARGGLRDQRLRGGEVALDVRGRGHLRGGDDEAPAHRFGPRFAFAAARLRGPRRAGRGARGVSPIAYAWRNGQRQRANTGHSPHRGRRAMQIFRPWKITRSVVRVHRSRGNDGHELALDLEGILRPGDAQPVAHAQDVGVDGDALRDVVGVAEHDAGRLAPHARQLRHLVHGARHFAAVALGERRRAPEQAAATSPGRSRWGGRWPRGLPASPAPSPARRGSGGRAPASPGSPARRCTARTGWWRRRARRDCGR